MADENDTDTTEEYQGRVIPQSRYDEEARRRKEERQKREAAEARAAELEQRISELEDRDKTDVERLTKAQEKLEQRAKAAEERAAELEAKSMRDAKASLVERAAAKLNFHDPGLASQLVALDEIDDAKAADAAVKTLAKERAYLIRSEPSEGAKLRKVGVDGQTIDESRDHNLVTQEEQNRLWGQELAGIALGPNTGAGQAPSGQ